MYSIYSTVAGKTVCLHDDTVSSEKVKVIEPVLTFEDSAAGSLTFKLAPGNVGYDLYTTYEEVADGFENIKDYDVYQYFEEGLSDVNDISGTFIQGRLERVSTDPRYRLCSEDYITLDPATNTFSLTATSSTSNVVQWMLYFYDVNKDYMASATFYDSGHVDVWGSMPQGARYVKFMLRYKPVDNTEIDISPSEITSVIYSSGLTGYRLRTSIMPLDEETTAVNLVSKSLKYRLDLSDAFEQSDLGVMTSDYIPLDEYTTLFQISVETVSGKDIQWMTFLYDEDKNYIGSGRWLENEQIDWWNVPAGSKYVKFSVRYKPISGEEQLITPSDIVSAFYGYGPRLTYIVHSYDLNQHYIESSNGTRSGGTTSIPQTARYIRLELKYESYVPISASENQNAHLTEQKGKTKTVANSVDLVGRMTSIITVYRLEGVTDQTTGKTTYTQKEIFEGRVLTEDRDFWNVRSIYCEGELSYLNDTCQPQREYGEVTTQSFLESIFEIHNSRVVDGKKFYVGQIWVENDSVTRTTQYQKTIEVLNSLIEELGGHIKIRKENGKRYIDWYKDYGTGSQTVQTINFGVNLLEYSAGWDMSNLCTVLLPTGHVVQEAKSTSVGSELELNNGYGPTYGQLLYLDDETKEVLIEADPSLSGYKTAVAVVEPGKNYYFSGRLHGGYVAYTIKSNADGTGDYYDGGTKTAGSQSQLGFVDFVDQKITIPAGAHSVVMCSYGNDIPLALKTEIPATEGLDTYLTIEDVSDDAGWHTKGSPYISNQDLVTRYGWIERRLALDSVEDAATLYNSAKLYLQSTQFDEMTLEVTAIDMNLLGVHTEFIDVLDNIRVVSAPHGLDKLFPVTKIEIPLDSPAEQKFTLGTNTEQSLTSSNNETNNDILSKIAAIPSASKTLAAAKSNAAQMINNATNGYISFVNDDDGHPKELVISNMPDYTRSDAKVWRWNMNGLAYSDHGYVMDEQLALAITANGAIVADYITAGTLTSININGCNILVGGLDGQSGSVIVRAGGTSRYAVKLDQGAIKFGLYENGTFSEFADMKGDISYEVGEDVLHGIRIRTDVLAFDTDHLWTGAKSGGDSVEGINGPVDCGDFRIYFRHGIAYDAEQISQGE